MADSDRRSTLLDSYENAAVIVSGIGADELGHPTPCPKYDRDATHGQRPVDKGRAERRPRVTRPLLPAPRALMRAAGPEESRRRCGRFG